MCLVGEMMEDSDDITGCVVSIRKGQDRIAIWTKTIDEDICKRIGAFWKKVLAGESDAPVYKIGFMPHDAAKTGARGSKDIFEI